MTMHIVGVLGSHRPRGQVSWIQTLLLGYLVWTAAWLAPGPGIYAQESRLPEGDDDEVRRHGIFVDSLDVSLINIEVYVTCDGQPLTDLTAADFEVLDDGEPVEITHFFRVEAGRRRPMSGATPAPDDAPEPASADLDTEPSSIVVLVDQAFISPMSRKLVFDQLGQKLDRLMADGSRVMIVSKTKEVKIAQHLTSGRAEVLTTLERLAGVATGNYAAEVRSVVQAIEQRNTATSSRQTGPGQSSAAQTNTAESDARAAFMDAQGHSQRMHAEVLSSLALLRGFLGSLAGLPGRKAVLYVADRLPLRSGELVWRLWFDKFGFDWGTEFGAPSVDAALRDFDATRGIRDLIADANANRIAFYPIGAGADAGPDLQGVESRGVSTPNGTFTRLSESDDGLRWLANRTGGRAAIGRGDVGEFFDQISQDLTHYYSLAYPSPHRGDGESHSVEIRLRAQSPAAAGEPPAKLRYLADYRDKSADQQMADRTFASLMLDIGANPLDVKVVVGDSEKRKGGHFSVPLTIQVPVANLVLVPGKTLQQAQMSIQLIVRDQAGRLSDPVQVRLPVEIPHAGLLGALSKTAAYETTVTLRSGRQTIGIGVQDDFGAVSSTVNVDIDVGGRR